MNNALTLTNLLLGLLAQQQKIAALLRTAQAEGRDVTSAELDALLADDNAARDALEAEIQTQRMLEGNHTPAG